MSAEEYVLTHPETGEQWRLEVTDESVNGHHLKPGAAKPTLTRVPVKRCESEDPSLEAKEWAQRLLDDGFMDQEQYRQSIAYREMELIVEVAEPVDESQLSPELQNELTRNSEGEVVLSCGGSQIRIGVDQTRERSSSLISTIAAKDLMGAFRLMAEGSARVTITAEEEDREFFDNADVVTPELAAEKFPDFKDELEQLGLWQRPLSDIAKSSSSGGGYWF